MTPQERVGAPATAFPVTHGCAGDVCVTCADEAAAVRVVRLLDAGLALVDTGAGHQEAVSVALVEATVGDTVLIHAKEAIAVVREGTDR